MHVRLVPPSSITSARGRRRLHVDCVSTLARGLRAGRCDSAGRQELICKCPRRRTGNGGYQPILRQSKEPTRQIRKEHLRTDHDGENPQGIKPLLADVGADVGDEHQGQDAPKAGRRYLEPVYRPPGAVGQYDTADAWSWACTLEKLGDNTGEQTYPKHRPKRFQSSCNQRPFHEQVAQICQL